MSFLLDTTSMPLVLMAAFLLKHFVCDFVLQFDFQIESKGHYGRFGGVSHALFHGIGSAIALAVFDIWSTSTIAVVVVAEVVFHYHVDWAKTRLTAHLTPKDRLFWIAFGADQLLHSLTYVVMAAWLLKVVS